MRPMRCFVGPGLRYTIDSMSACTGILYYFSSTANPILYNLMSRKFRAAFRRTVCCWFPCSSCGRAERAPAQQAPAPVAVDAAVRRRVLHRRPGHFNPAADDRSAKDEPAQRKVTSVKSNLAKGRIAVLSPIAAANVFIRCGHWAGTFASGGRRTMRNKLMRRYHAMGLQMTQSKMSLPVGNLDLWTYVPWTHIHKSPNGISIGSAVLHSTPMCLTHTDTRTTLRPDAHRQTQPGDCCTETTRAFIMMI